jgi:hypothetical protein
MSYLQYSSGSRSFEDGVGLLARIAGNVTDDQPKRAARENIVVGVTNVVDPIVSL